MQIRDLMEATAIDPGVIQAVITKSKKGYHVKSKDRSKNLGGPYKTREEAVKRLQQVEYFKHRG